MIYIGTHILHFHNFIIIFIVIIIIILIFYYYCYQLLSLFSCIQFLYIVFQVLKVLLKKFARFSHQIFYFLLFYISFSIHKFLELHSTLSEKKIFVTIYPFLTDLLKPPNLFNGQNSLSMMKVFCRCSLIFFGDQTSNPPDSTEIHDNITSL